MSATSVWDAPSGECLRGRGRYGVVCMQVTLCDPYLSALSVRYFNKRRYINPLPLPFFLFFHTPLTWLLYRTMLFVAYFEQNRVDR